MSKILIVDDEPMMVMVTKRVLSQKYEVLSASSGKEALEIYDREKPDLILSDLLMPEMNGFEMHQILQERYTERIPIMYMTADDTDETENKGFDLGAADFIRKPFRPDILLRRVENILTNLSQIKDLKEEATTDKLTGFINKGGAGAVFGRCCKEERGALMVVDLDSFKLVNDLYGHEAGDSILVAFAGVIRSILRSEDTVARIGGDEFLVFTKNVIEERVIADISQRINQQFLVRAKSLLGEDMDIPLGVSIGAVFVPAMGTEYEDLFKLADKALYLVKQNGKHGYFVYRSDVTPVASEEAENPTADLKRISQILEERNTPNAALWLNQEAFGSIYRFLIRFIQRYHGTAYKLIFTLVPSEPGLDKETFNNLVQMFGENLSRGLRKSDIMMQSKANQFFVLLPELNSQYIAAVIRRILDRWYLLDGASRLDILYDSALIRENGDAE